MPAFGHPLGKEMFPPVTPDPPLTDAALSRSHQALGTREQSSAPPSPRPLLRRLQRAGRSPRGLLLSKPDRPRALSRSSEDMPASPCPSFGALLGTCSSTLTSSTSRALSAGLLSSHSSPSLDWCQVLLCPRCRVWHLFLFSFMRCMISQCFNLSRSLCKASCPLRESTAPPGLVSSNWLRVQSNPASR